MATTNELVIKINGDIKSFEDALNKVKAKTDDLSDQLGSMARTAGIAFAVLAGEVGLAVKAFHESELATNKLTTALQNQGIYSKELVDDYQKQATALQDLTGISDEAVLQAQATIQSYIGQQKVTEDLTKTIADFAVAQGIDLSSAADVLGKAIQGNTAMLKRNGIQIDENLTKQERMEQVITKVSAKFAGQAEAAGSGLGSLKKLKEAFSDLQEQIGAKFSPVIEKVSLFFTKLFKEIGSSKELINFTVSMIGAGLAVSGTVLAVTAGGLAFLKLKAALEAFGLVGVSTKTLIKGLAGAGGIGLLLVAITEIALHWESILPRIQAAYAAFAETISKGLQGIGNIMTGLFRIDINQIKTGVIQAAKSFGAGYDEYNKVVDQKLKEQAKVEQDAEEKKKARNDKNAAARQAKELENERRTLELKRAEKDLQVLEEEQASAKLIELKKKEIEDLKLIADETYKGDKDALTERAEDLRELQKTQADLDLEAKKKFQEDILTNNEEYQALTEEQQALFDEQNNQKLQEQVLTEKSVRMQAAADRTTQQIQDNNRFLMDQQKFGTAYATLNKAMHSEVFQGTKQAFGEMAQFQQSSNSILKGIGKASAVANIIVKTAESAMNIYAGFSAIPFVGPALGAAGAAAAIAFGAEQVQRVTAAAQGGLLTGGIPGVDSIPVIAQRGELISPTQNFEEVIGSVRAAREAERLGAPIGSSEGGSAKILVGFDGKQASQVLTVRQIEDRALGVSQEASAS